MIGEKTIDKKTIDKKTIKKTIKKRCHHCNKRLKLLEENLCKCNKIFCPKHRLCHSHDCDYDTKSTNKKKISDENPKVESDKVDKI
jgi:hypothetical protein